ncbi:MAG: hypothetical protein ACRDYX_21590 [Egibacteraceae bacterium]
MLDLLAAGIALGTFALIVIRPGGGPEWVYATLVPLGRVPLGEAVHTLACTGPVLVFLLAVTVLADAVGRVGLFDALALAAGRAAGNSVQQLLGAVLLIAFICYDRAFARRHRRATPAVVAVIRRTQATCPATRAPDGVRGQRRVPAPAGQQPHEPPRREPAARRAWARGSDVAGAASRCCSCSGACSEHADSLSPGILGRCLE